MLYQPIKRFFDLLASSIALVVLSPLLIPVSIALKLTGEGYVFYLQERVGYKNRRFKMYKFATMLKDSPNLPGGVITTKNDPRLTPMGSFLRKTKINELPQLLNIFLGHMSVVGPRPVAIKSFEAYPEEVQEVINNVRPGLTGVGSIIFRDEESLLSKVKDEGGDAWTYYEDTIAPYKGKVEQWYQENDGFFTDLMCIFITVWVVLFPQSELIYKVFPSIPRRPF